jgi:hypothetical protein
MFDTLKSYSEHCKEVNVIKTKMVVFRNGGKVKHVEKCFYDNVELVDVFTYLGVDFKYNLTTPSNHLLPKLKVYIFFVKQGERK